MVRGDGLLSSFLLEKELKYLKITAEPIENDLNHNEMEMNNIGNDQRKLQGRFASKLPGVNWVCKQIIDGLLVNKHRNVNDNHWHAQF